MSANNTITPGANYANYAAEDGPGAEAGAVESGPTPSHATLTLDFSGTTAITSMNTVPIGYVGNGDDATVKTTELDADGNEMEMVAVINDPLRQGPQQQNLPQVTPGVTANIHQRLGHSFCGLCCDMRRAVIILNSINLGIALFGIVLVAYVTSDKFQDYANDVEDDDYAYRLSLYLEEQRRSIYIGFVIAMVMYVIGVLGGIRFNHLIVVVVTIWYCVLVITNMIFTFSLYAILWNTLCLYPHIVFLVELQRGIMTYDRYDAYEKQSCCCV